MSSYNIVDSKGNVILTEDRDAAYEIAEALSTNADIKVEVQVKESKGK